MKVGLDARALGGRFTGDRTYWRGLISGLAEIDKTTEYILFLRKNLENDDKLLLPVNFRTVVVPALSERIWSLYTFGVAARQHKIDIAHVQYTLPPFLSCKTVTTVHDISFHLFPQLFSAKDRLLLNTTVPSSIRRADAVLTVSESSRSDILRAYPFLRKEKITATPLAVGPEFRPLESAQIAAARKKLSDRYGLDGDYILSVGVLQPRKNLPLLIDAFNTVKDQIQMPCSLAIVGKIGWLSSETEAAIAGAGEQVKMLGYVADEDLPLLYACAMITAYPSLYEGFGLPVLEAMACGSPVIASSNSSLPEVVGNAGILLSAHDKVAWMDALLTLAKNGSERCKMRSAGLERAATFSWAQTAALTRQVYRNVMHVDDEK